MEDNYLNIILQAYRERVALNPKYSMRSFARDLRMAPSSLSEVLNGKKGISPAKAASMARALRLPDWQVPLFCDLATAAHGKSRIARTKAKERLEETNRVSLPVLPKAKVDAIQSWVDLAVLELTHVRGFRSDTGWIANKLGVPVATAKESVARLSGCGLLDTSSEKWIDTSPSASTTDGVSNETIRKFHRSVLQLALKKADNPDLSARTLKAAIFSLPKGEAKLAQEILNEALRKIVAIARKPGLERDQVLCFSAQLFAVSREDIE